MILANKEINTILENLSRIDRQIKLIKEGNLEVKGTGVNRLDIISEKTLSINSIINKI